MPDGVTALDDAAPFLLEDVPPLPPPAGAVLSAAAEAPPAVKIEQGNGAVPVGAVAAHDTTAIKPDPGAGVDASPPPVAVGPVGWCSAGTAGPQRVAWLSTSTNRARFTTLSVRAGSGSTTAERFEYVLVIDARHEAEG